MVAVKLRGMPFSTSFDDMHDFFRPYDLIEGSAIMGIGAGTGLMNGYGAILFQNEKQAKLAVKEQDGEYMGQRFIDLSLISYGDYLDFNGP